MSRKWTAADVPDQSGRVAIVTGANSGLGYDTAAVLAARGAHVVMAVRDLDKGTAAAERIRAATPRATISLQELDLTSLDSVRAAAAALRNTFDRIDLLINNAGVMYVPARELTRDGFEMQFGTNHLGHFALTGLLLPALRSAPSPRVVTLTSAFAWSGRIDFDDLQSERRYRKWAAYAQSKLANLVFAKELDRRIAEVTSVAAHPGYAATNLQQTGPRMQGSRLLEKIVGIGNAVVAQSAAAGALPSLYAATAPDVHGGACYGPRLLQYRGAPTEVVTPPQANRAGQAERLWDVSETLTGVAYAAAAS